MITGRVNSYREAVISVSLSGFEGTALEVDAVVDTGYAGYLTLPTSMIEALGLQSIGVGYLTLADGNELASEVCVATVLWDHQRREIEVDSLESEVLVGMALLEGYDLRIRVISGGDVAIESIC